MLCPICAHVGNYAVQFDDEGEMIRHLQKVHGLLPNEAKSELADANFIEEDLDGYTA